ncbi:MAG: protein O-mannosyl-transferase family, partial [Gemmatimonadales bacterium]
MTTTSAAARWRVAGVAGGTALLGYLLTLAPTVTFWDSGELLAAAKGLGIPHPPGSPFFVLVAHVWAMLLPFGT